MSDSRFVTISIFTKDEMARRRGQRKGHLINRGGSWLLRYWVDSATEVNPKTGRAKRDRITRTIGISSGAGAISKRQAQRLAWEETLSTLDAGHIRPSSARTFKEFLDARYRPDVMDTLKVTTQVFKESILKRHVLPALGSKPLRDISPAHVQDLINLKRRQGLSPGTLKHIKNQISAILGHAKAHRWYFGELPTEATKLPRIESAARQALTWEQVVAIANALPEPVSTLVALLTVTGLRIAEALGLRWQHVNLTANPVAQGSETIPPYSLIVRENWISSVKKGAERRQSLKTPTSNRTLPIPEWFVPRLLALAGDPTDPLFRGRHGQPLDAHNLAARVLKPAVKLLGLSWVSFHVFRHSYSTLLHDAGLSMDERVRAMGHASEAMTIRYTHPQFEASRGKLTGLVDGKMLN